MPGLLWCWDLCGRGPAPPVSEPTIMAAASGTRERECLPYSTPL